MKYSLDTIKRISTLPQYSIFFQFYNVEILQEILVDDLFIIDSDLYRKIESKLFKLDLNDQQKKLTEIQRIYKTGRTKNPVHLNEIRGLLTYLNAVKQIDINYFLTVKDIWQLGATNSTPIICINNLAHKIVENKKQYIHEIRMLQTLLRLKYHGCKQYLIQPYIDFIFKRINIYEKFLYEYLPEMFTKELSPIKVKNKSESELIANAFGVEIDTAYTNYFEINRFGRTESISDFISLSKCLLSEDVTNWSKYCNLENFVQFFISNGLLRMNIYLDVYMYRTNILYTHTAEEIAEEKRNMWHLFDFIEPENLFNFCLIPIIAMIEDNCKPDPQYNVSDVNKAIVGNLKLLIAEGLLTEEYLERFHEGNFI